MAGRVDQRFAAALAALLGGELVSVRRLGEEVIGLELEDGRRLVAKGVARQSLPSWEPGRPWAELVALDALDRGGSASAQSRRRRSRTWLARHRVCVRRRF